MSFTGFTGHTPERIISTNPERLSRKPAWLRRVRADESVKMNRLDPSNGLEISSDNQITRASMGFTLLVFLVGLIAQIVVYAPMFKILPAGDDFPVLNDLNRGNEQGALSLLTKSYSNVNYRPVRALGVWFFGSVAKDNRIFSLHLMHFIGATFFSCCALLWLRTIPLGKIGVIIASIVVFFHPVMVASICSLDSIDSTVSSGILWLGVWCVYRFRDSLIICSILAAVCFMIGGVTKEYIFALVPLAAWTLFYLSDRQRIFRVITVCGVLILCFVALMVIRYFTMEGGKGRGLEYLDLSPGAFVANLATLTVGLLLPGNTVTAYLNRNEPTVFLALPPILALCSLVGIGLWRFYSPENARYRTIIYLSVALLLSYFPMIVMFHVSEMYVPPLVIPFALLCGVAADGWTLKPKWASGIAAVISIALLANSVIAIRSKIAGMRSVGERADIQAEQILNLLPKDATNLNIAICYNTFGMKKNRHYSVFAMGDEITLKHPISLDWKAPGRNLRCYYSSNAGEILDRTVKYDYVLVWDHRKSVMRISSIDELWPKTQLGF